MKCSELYLKLITVISTPNAFYEMLFCLFVFAVDVVDDDGCCCCFCLFVLLLTFLILFMCSCLSVIVCVFMLYPSLIILLCIWVFSHRCPLYDLKWSHGRLIEQIKQSSIKTSYCIYFLSMLEPSGRVWRICLLGQQTCAV